MAYEIDTPSWRLDSSIILTPADVGRCLDSYIIHTLADRVAAPLISGAWNEPSGFLWYNELTTQFSGKYLISLESCSMQLSNSIYYIFVALLYHEILLKAAALLIIGTLSGPSTLVWHNEKTTWFSVVYIISLESCDTQLSNSICYILVALLYPKISLKVATPPIFSALSGPSGFLWSTLYH